MLVLIEGNISASKSTVCDGLNGTKYPEPLEKENPWLPLFYEDPKRNGTFMQLYTLFYRYKQWKLAQARSAMYPDEIQLLDRSLFFDACFALVNHEIGNISDREFELYMMAHETLQEQIYFPNVCLWLRVRPEICLERLKARSRSCEVGVTLDYLERLEDAYGRVMRTLRCKCPVVEIDAEQSREDVLHDCEKAIQMHQRAVNIQFPRWKGGYSDEPEQDDLTGLGFERRYK